MVKARKYVVKNHFNGTPKISDYELVEYELPPIQDGEILVKAEWISVDPYLQAYNPSLKPPYDQFSFQLGTVQESKDPDYPVGTKIITHKGWCDYAIVKENKTTPKNIPNDVIYKLPDLKGLSPSLSVGAVGMPGATAYLAFVEICKPKAGETVVVTGAAGAVGSLVGQIAKLKGCRVVGFTGSDEKVQWLEKELGFDKAVNYKKDNFKQAFYDAVPEGVDCYFDNVGGEVSSMIMERMNRKGRVAICGSISSYGASEKPKATILQPSILFSELKVEGFMIWQNYERWQEAFSELITWISNGQLKAPEHITVGFEKVFDAFVGMLAGDNFGKAVVKV